MLTNEQAFSLNIESLKKVHMIGISSPFSSFCASNLINRGIALTASELNQNNDSARSWVEKGILYPGGHNKKYVTQDLDLVVFPNGPIPGNPECERAEQLGLPTISISQLCGLISKDLKTIAVVGTHGKSTTTAVLVWVLHKCLETPSFILGDADDLIFEINKNWNVNPKNGYLILEACEYKKQFIQRAPQPYISVVTNMGLDHTDFYHSQEDYNLAFAEFLDNTRNHIVIDTKQAVEKDILSKINQNIEVTDINKFRNDTSNLRLPLPGDHNIENFLRAFTAAVAIGIDREAAKKALLTFPGLTKRFELAGNTPNGNPVYKDYAHNPTKLKGLIKTTKQTFPDKKMVLVWQPHSAERTYTFRDGFSKAIRGSDLVLLTDIFNPVREPEELRKLISSEEFYKELHAENENIVYTGDLKKTTDKIKGMDSKERNLVFVLASAGDLHSIAKNLVDQ